MIKRFTEQFRWLSNFTEVQVFLDEKPYPSVENAYVAAKTLDKRLRPILQKINSAEAKQLGKILPLRSDWDSVKLKVMENLLRQKFSYKWFADKLAETGEQEIVEGNSWHDNFWGSCVCDECGDKGENHLGRLLMKIRGEQVQLPLDFS